MSGRAVILWAIGEPQSHPIGCAYETYALGATGHIVVDLPKADPPERTVWVDRLRVCGPDMTVKDVGPGDPDYFGAVLEHYVQRFAMTLPPAALNPETGECHTSAVPGEQQKPAITGEQYEAAFRAYDAAEAAGRTTHDRVRAALHAALNPEAEEATDA